MIINKLHPQTFLDPKHRHKYTNSIIHYGSTYPGYIMYYTIIATKAELNTLWFYLSWLHNVLHNNSN